MNSFLQKLLHLGVGIETLLKRVSQSIERLFLSKDEAGRLDRLRNPGDYEGK